MVFIRAWESIAYQQRIQIAITSLDVTQIARPSCLDCRGSGKHKANRGRLLSVSGPTGASGFVQVAQRLGIAEPCDTIHLDETRYDLIVVTRHEKAEVSRELDRWVTADKYV